MERKVLLTFIAGLMGCGPQAPPAGFQDGGLDGALTCEGVSCSNHGTCVEDAEGVRCVCETGYVAQGLECVPDACTPNPCTQPPEPTCSDEGRRLVFPETGTCSVGPNGPECDYGSPEEEPCPDGTRCASGICVPDNQAPPAPGDLIVTEIMKDPVGVPDKDGEWFEILNVSDHEVDLTGLVIRDDGGNEFGVVSTEPIMVQPQEYFVFGPNADRGTNGGVTVDYEYFGLMLNNDGDGLTLLFEGEIIDEVHYDTVNFPEAIGASLSLDPGQLSASANDSPDAWCEATTPYDVRNLGTPGAPNDECTNNPCNPNPCTEPPAPTCNGSVRVYPTLQTGTCTLDASGLPSCDYGLTQEDCSQSGLACVEGTCRIPPPGPGDLVITEFLANPNVPDTVGEWFEVLNVTDHALDIQGLVLKDEGTDVHTLPVGTPIVVQPGQYFLFGCSDDLGVSGFAGVDYVYPRGSFQLANTSDEIQLVMDGVLVDEVWYGQNAPSGDRGPGVSTGTSTALNPAVTADATANDLGVNWCYSSSTYGGSDQGTPGEPNDTCP